MTIELEPDEGTAQRQLNAITAFMFAIGHAQADLLGEGLAFAFAEADSISRAGRNLALGGSHPPRGRGRHGVSWVYARLVEMVESDALIRPRLMRLVGRGTGHGVTEPDFEGYALPGGEYRYLPAPATEVDVSVATHRVQRDRSVVERTSLDIGRTLVHELVVHAWRDISYYQPAPSGGDRPARGAAESRHRAREHAMAPPGTLHNYADAEADLIDLYWDIEMERDPAYHQRDRHAARIARQAGGVMGTRILRWQEDTASRRRDAAEMRRERLRFLEQRLRFAEDVRRAQAQDRRAP